jgi:hypothetical protein
VINEIVTMQGRQSNPRAETERLAHCPAQDFHVKPVWSRGALDDRGRTPLRIDLDLRRSDSINERPAKYDSGNKMTV